MIIIVETDNSIAVQFEGTVKEVAQDIWAILESYRDNLGTENTLKFIEAYLRHLEDEIQGE